MNILIAIIIITAVISFAAPMGSANFEKYKFSVGAILNRKEYIRLLSSGFLHADIMHLVFNMLTLYFFGPVVIQGFGNLGFLIIYFGSILLGNMFSLFVYQRQPWYSAIGASGGVSGILFASIALIPHLEIYMFFIPIGIPGYIFGLVYFSYSVYMMLNPNHNDNIGHAAHLGGAFFGLIYAVANQPQAAIENSMYLGIMSLPLIYLGYEIFVKKRIG
ncbi:MULTISPECIES: rhomboid family intramembrane serine protease [Chryseobacterium]|uniref:Rhomboid family intramembrane serine protease n=1 Tax=Chryseobacterium gambrini TaxID=373672 RepID=A0ABN7CAL2_9FLAO|nr:MULTISPECIES: rhomboid family intramembrane serine protease [Chryseobacterium]HAO09351.1 rhomboid family intramembrane serine protease [Chryseobacterium sp.]MCQ4141363.1 rhomboid family intramembrane serine protease [Chryseobacterium sp. EO14]PTT75460.1 rhomboid family intramembrane serine protease [Chryseobacterium sp. HMWF001]PVV54148.1 rhomboid family intramembrane serine protease [Chryseobacterium sp. HMWF035]WBX97599.1 rhomboid family intramembrane serine protease [Chryseobacterium gam